MKEFESKLDRLRKFCAEGQYDGVFLSRRANFAWLTCGKNNAVERSSEYGVVDLLVTKEKHFLIASEIEKYRFTEEELPSDLGFELITFPWGDGAKEKVVKQITATKRIASDSRVFDFDYQDEKISTLRFALTPEEVDRVRKGARTAALAFEKICRSIEPGVTEHEVAAELLSDSVRAGGDAPVVLVAFDERMYKYRHPVPTAKRLQKKALLVRSSKEKGLIVSISRIISFGPPDAEFTKRYESCARVNAEMISATVPGAIGSDIFAKTVAAYALAGYTDEWKYHHQGGALGYFTRDYIIDSSCTQRVLENQLFSWNPSILGTKVEDTILVNKVGHEILTEMPSWPALEFSIHGETIKCPDVLVR